MVLRLVGSCVQLPGALRQVCDVVTGCLFSVLEASRVSTPGFLEGTPRSPLLSPWSGKLPGAVAAESEDQNWLSALDHDIWARPTLSGPQ